MANGTFNLSIGGTFLANGVTWTIPTGQTEITIGQEYVKSTYVAPFAGEAALALGGVANPILIYISNRDSANYVDLLVGSGGAIAAQILFGQAAWVPWVATVAPYVLADTADVLIDYAVFDTQA